ncbi:hypothetical protein ACFWIA_27960 [Streptomyces sp. NPDC127068]|uniref:hypothetical protein n=1 Tax=Streptomyces sp. NPDC127068 TaxID=3347127 RepID=UPI00365770C1
MDESFVVRVDDGLFCISDGEDITVESTRWSTGLLAPMDHGAWIRTGIHTGRVTVRTEMHSAAPPGDTGPWEEIVEASVHSPGGAMFVDPGYVAGELPYLASGGPGWYRLRVHAHGRGLNPDGVSTDPTERYLIQAWPQDWSPQQVLQSSPRIEESLADNADEPTGPPVHRPARTEPETAERKRLLRHIRNR